MAGEGLFFTGDVLKNNRELLKEEAARDQLAMQTEQLKMQQEELAMKRKENAKKNAPNYEDFGKPAVGGFSPASQLNIENYIDQVGNNPEDFALKASLESEVRSNNSLLANITTNHQANMVSIAKGGDTLDQANYRKDEDGVYEFQKRLDHITPLVNSGKMSAEDAYKYYYDNTDGSLYNVREQTSLGQGIVDAYKGQGKSSELYDSKDGKKTMFGYNDDAKNAIYTSYKNELKFNNKGEFETPAGEAAYFKSITDNELTMVLFFRDKKGKLTADENSPILAQLDPKSEDFNKDLSNEYVDYLARLQTDPFMVDEGLKAKPGRAKDTTFDKAYNLRDWEIMNSSNKLTEEKYGDHGKMLSDYNFTSNLGGEHDVQKSMLNNMQVADGSGITNDQAKQYLEKQIASSGGKLKSKLSQIAISETHDNMYGIYSIQISKESATQEDGDKYAGDGKSRVIEFSIPIENLGGIKIGDVPQRWKNSFDLDKENKYDPQEESSSQNKGVGSKYNKNT